MNLLKISIVIPIFNGLDYTKVCLQSLFNDIDFKAEDVKFSIVVVDDGSTDNSSNWIKSNFPEVHLQRGDGNLWWSGGINIGVRYALDQLNTDYIIWWNNDILVDEMYFTNLVQRLKSNDINTIIGSKVYLANQKQIIWAMGGMFNPITGEKSMVGSDFPDSEKYEDVIEVDWLPGMGTVTHKSVYKI